MNSKPLPVELGKIYLLLVDLRVIVGFYLTLVIFALLRAGAQSESIGFFQLIALAVAGFLTINLLEYLIHRFLFHPTKYGNRFKKIILNIHSRHHRFNDVEEYAILPITTSFVLIALSTAIFRFFTDASLKIVLIYFVFCVASYIFHEILHYMIHQSKLPGRLGRYYTDFHQVHHLQDAHKNYCFISPFWDIVFGTYQRRVNGENISDS